MSDTGKDLSLSRVGVGTTVMKKDVTHPAHACAYEKARGKLFARADHGGITFLQNYNHLAPRLAGADRAAYAHTLHFMRMCRALKQL